MTDTARSLFATMLLKIQSSEFSKTFMKGSDYYLYRFPSPSMKKTLRTAIIFGYTLGRSEEQMN